jgi:hypothetical protein
MPAILLLLVSVAGTAHSQVPGCTAAQAQRADQGIDRLHTWGSLYTWYKNYRHCDDGVMAEDYSEAVARVLVDHWSTLPRLAQLGKRDPPSKNLLFVMSMPH